MIKNNLTPIFGGIFATIASFLGGFDNVIITLLTFMVADYVTGVLKAIKLKQLNSQIGVKGIVKKVGYLVVIAVTVKLDTLFGNTSAIRTLVIYSFIANEGLSIVENASILEIIVPEKVKNVLEQLKSKETKNAEMPKKND